jgi:predicted AAA+ superfamily ATPase
MGKKKYTDEQKEVARRLLRSSVLPRDSLPYSREFNRLYSEYCRERKQKIDKHSFWQLLCRAGKEGGLKRSKKIQLPKTVKRLSILTQDEAFELLRLCPESIGSRDRLPYTTEFDSMYSKFVEHTGRKLTRNEFWRSLLRIAKRSRKPSAIPDVEIKGEVPVALEAHLFRMNPWWRGEHGREPPDYKRTIYTDIFRKFTRGDSSVISVRGPRQIGKSTLQLQTIRDLILTRIAGPAQILRIQFDDLQCLGALTDPILSIIDWYEKKILKRSINESVRKKKPIFILLDEIQDVKGWDSQLKALVDHISCRVYITGSSALRIQQGRDSLAGRLYPKELGALSLVEIAGFRNYGRIEPFVTEVDLSEWTKPSFWYDLGRYDAGVPLIIDSAYKEFGKFGGYPKCHKSVDIKWPEASRYLTDLVVKRTIDHDLRVGKGRRDSRILSEVFRLAVRYAGQTPKLRTLAAELNCLLETDIRPADISSYLDFLENSLLLKLIEPLQLRNKKQSSPRKICICDHAVRAAWLQEPIPLLSDRNYDAANHNVDLAGHIIESTVGYFLSGFEDVKLFHFPERSEEKEIDFVMTVGDFRIPIEVKFRQNVFRSDFIEGIESFVAKKAYNAPFGLIISKNDCGRQGNVIAVPVKRLLLLR